MDSIHSHLGEPAVGSGRVRVAVGTAVSAARRVLELAGIAALAAAGNYCANPPEPFAPLVVEFSDEVFSAPWIIADARHPREFAKGHIEGAVNLSEEKFDSQVAGLLDKWAPGMKIGVYCDSAGCGSSERVAERLRRDFGLDGVFVLKGDWREWKR